jgi:DNA-binding GntR family transcriptional regulator
MKEFQECLEHEHDYVKLQKINTQFHDHLYALSKSPKLIKMINQLRAHISRFRQIILKQKEYAQKSNEDHIKMLEAIKNRDGDTVERLVRAHIFKGKNAVLNQLENEEKERISA